MSGNKKISYLLQRGVVRVISWYKYIVSPLFPPCCRFVPTCSSYAMQAIEKHGLVKGTFFALKRILRCHPFCQGGYDPVP
ncbi:MAG: membrane protein insertion efficiency factor YidD [Desulfobacterales bacterium]|nr:MAG: membrane protein insertion efficiency factor YidD [Desulfobacterales bacterium]